MNNKVVEANIISAISDLSEIQRELWDALTIGETKERLCHIACYFSEALAPFLFRTAAKCNEVKENECRE